MVRHLPGQLAVLLLLVILPCVGDTQRELRKDLDELTDGRKPFKNLSADTVRADYLGTVSEATAPLVDSDLRGSNGVFRLSQDQNSASVRFPLNPPGVAATISIGDDSLLMVQSDEGATIPMTTNTFNLKPPLAVGVAPWIVIVNEGTNLHEIHENIAFKHVRLQENGDNFVMGQGDVVILFTHQLEAFTFLDPKFSGIAHDN
jgi:hypothetical protein